MRNFKTVIFSLSLAVGPALALAQTPRLLKIPHNHNSAHGGLVLMFGDYHGELIKMKGGKEIVLFLSDKLRDPQKPEDFDLEVNLVEGAKKTALTGSATDSVSFALPAKTSGDAQLEVKVFRKNPPKGAVTTANPQTASLAKVPEMKPMDHSMHQGH